MGKVLAIDGGGSRTRAVVVCDNWAGEVLRGEAGTSNVSTVGVAGMLHAVKQAVSAATNTNNDTNTTTTGYGQFAAVWCGFAGVGSPDSQLYLDCQAALLELFGIKDANRFVLTTDANLLAGQLALCDPPAAAGIGVIAGTGSVAMAFHNKQLVGRSGGWGHSLGDEGSGHWIGLEGLKSALAVNDRRVVCQTISQPLPEFSPWQLEILSQLGVEHGPNLHIRVLQAVGQEKTRVSNLSRAVFNGFEMSDPAACQIVTAAATHLADMTLRLVDIANPDTTCLILGGSLCGVEWFRNLVLNRIGVTFKQVSVVDDPGRTAAMSLAKQFL